jgi:hypothetical protein
MLPQSESGPGTFAAFADRDIGAPDFGACRMSTVSEEATRSSRLRRPLLRVKILTRGFSMIFT